MGKLATLTLLLCGTAFAQYTPPGNSWNPPNPATFPGSVAIANTVLGTNGLSNTGTAATDSASLGPELTSASGWTSTGWTGGYNAFAHTPGNTSALSRAILGITIGNYYLVSIVISSSSTGSLTASIGGTPVPAGNGTIFSGNNSYVAGPKVVGTGAFILTPSSTFDGTVTVSVKLIIPIPSTAYNFNLLDSGGVQSAAISQQNHLAGNIFIGEPGNAMGGQYNIPIFAGFTQGPPGTALVAVGANSLGQNTTGWNNTAVGTVALAVNTTGSLNTAVGTDALNQNTSGSNNTAVGAQSLGANAPASTSTGSGNSAFGVNALLNNAGADYNTAVGYAALGSNSTGLLLVAVGAQALAANTGSSNTAVGANALMANLGAANNSALGTNALELNTTGHENTAVGAGALGSVTTNSSNTAVGASALASSTGFANTALGFNSCTNLTNGNNVCLGSSTALSAAGDANSIVIGKSVTGAGSNTTVIGTSATTDTYAGSSSAASKMHVAYTIYPGVAFGSLLTCTTATNSATQVPLGTSVFCTDCKNVTDDTTGLYDAAAASGGHGTTVLCTGTTPGWRNH